MVALHSPLTRGPIQASRKAGSACSASTSTAAWVSTGPSMKAMLALVKISSSAVPTASGMPMPPWSSGAVTVFQPPAIQSRYSSGKPGVVETTPLAKRAPCWSAVRYSGAMRAAAKRPASVSRASSVSSSGTPGMSATWLARSPPRWRSANRISSTGAA